MYRLKNIRPITKGASGIVIDMPVPLNIRIWWNWGSLLGLCLGLQLLTGIILAINFCGDVSLAFFRVSHISSDVQMGWLLRMVHANGARLFFFCLYAHTGRGLYYGSYRYLHTWSVGVVLLLLVIATAFLGYVLPWGQISFWGATVITNLFSAIPYLGGDVVIWLWGGFAVDNATLTRFFRFHFLLPFLLSALVLIHLVFLHETGSNNPLGFGASSDKVSFYPYFILKDLYGFFLLFFFFMLFVFEAPWFLGDPENFINANPLVTPIHIQPEWYFLFAYAILRAIPNKLGGVVALALSILILLLIPFHYLSNFRGNVFYPINKFYFWRWANCGVLLTWIGMRPVEEPYIFTGQLLGIYYFMFFLVNPLIHLGWDKCLR